MKLSLEPAPFTVVVGIDFTPASDDALQTAFDFAERVAGAVVHVVHAVPPSASRDAQLAQSKKVEVELQNRLRSRNVRATVLVHALVGDASAILVSATRLLDADLLVVGTRVEGKEGTVARGGVAEAVLRDAPCSVYVVRRCDPVVQVCKAPKPTPETAFDPAKIRKARVACLYAIS